MDAALTRLVWERANGCCEYCRMFQAADDAPFEIDHIVARKHRGPSAANNLGLSCFYCNSFKGSDIASLDPKSGKLTRLFHPRRNAWARHFRWHGPYLIGRTPVGRATVALRFSSVGVHPRHPRMSPLLRPRASVRRIRLLWGGKLRSPRRHDR